MSSEIALSGEDLTLNVSLSSSPSRSFEAVTRGCSGCTSTSESEVVLDCARTEQTTYSLPIRAVFALLGLPDLLRRVVHFFTNRYTSHSPNKSPERSPAPLKRFLLFIFWTLGCISLNLVSGLVSLVLSMLPSRIYAAARSGLISLSQSATLQKGDASTTSVLQDRLEVANLAVKQLKSEGAALQEKLKVAGLRIARLEASKSDHAEYQALQAKYDRVSVELARATKENEDLKSTLTRLGKENAELRQCMAISSPDLEDETSRLGMLARLQNQRLDSCTFPKESEVGQGNYERRVTDVSEDSIIIVTSAASSTGPLEKPKAMSDPLFSTPVALSSAIKFQCTPQPGEPEAKNGNPIPVFTTKRPSLPPKVSKLKPLLLTTISTGLGSPRRNGPLHSRARWNGQRQQEKKSPIGPTNIRADGTKDANDQSKTHTLNPLAPVFTPRNLSVIASDVPTESDAEPKEPTPADGPAPKSHVSKALSPSSSPFIVTSPSPNSPFLRPPPQRRRSEDAPYPALTTTPPTPVTPSTPVTPNPLSSNHTSKAPGANPNPNPNPSGGNKGTPRSTRASSVKLIRARAALRNSKRLASGSNIITPASPAGFKTLPTSIGKNAKDVKARLIGRGLPPRRPLGEVTNADLDPEAASSRWPSV